ncbi:MAG: N-6 DNA methylase [Bacteroidota bacterium]
MEYLQQGIDEGYIKIDNEQKFITYLHPNKKYRFGDPEEKVRAEIYLQIIFDYGYKPERLDVELIVPRRTPSDLADIVVFADAEKKKPYIVVECKKSTVSEAEFVQAIEQGFGNAVSLGADWVWITSAIKSKYYSVDKEKPLERIANIEATIPMFGKTTTNKAKFYYGGVDEDGNTAFDLEKVEQDKLTKIFGLAHQALWAGGKRNPSEAFDELDKLIFCKLWDEKKDRKEGDPYDFQEYKKEDPEFLLKRVKAIYELGRLKDENVFREPIRLSAAELKTIVGYLAPINIGDTDLDAKGRAFEKFLGAFFRGDFGQYFTPREVVDFVVKVLPITKDSVVLDTSCGSGGFLLYALDKVRKQATDLYPKYKTDVKHQSKWRPYWHNFAENNLFGIEISEGIARTAKMNMIIHDDGHTNVVTSDGLLSADFKPKKNGETEEEQKAREKWNASTIQVKTGNHNFKYNHFDYVLTNPPFGSTIKLTEQAYLKYFNLGVKEVNWIDRKQKNKFDLGARDSQSTEVLFIEQCYRFLKPGGMLAIVVPDGILTNSSGQYVRDWIDEHYRIISVVSLPQDAFKANDAGVKSSVIFLQKLTEQQSDKIKTAKATIQDKLWEKPEYSKAISKLESKKSETIKKHIGFEYSIINWESEENLIHLKDIPKEQVAHLIGKIEHKQTDSFTSSDLKTLEKTEEYRLWKTETNTTYTDQINEIKETLQDEYLAALSKEVTNYPIFMAITENIGYDAAGRKTNINELDIVAIELEGFVTGIKAGKEVFFV